MNGAHEISLVLQYPNRSSASKMSLIVTKAVNVAFRDCQMYPHLECTTVSLWGILLNYFFWDVYPTAEQPPSYLPGHNSSRLDVVLRYLRDIDDWKFSTAAHIEYKKPSAGPDELRICEAQLQNKATTLFDTEGLGSIWSLSINGSLCRVFKYEKAPGAPLMQIMLTGQGGSSLDVEMDYMNINDEDEGELINSILRDIRESMG